MLRVYTSDASVYGSKSVHFMAIDTFDNLSMLYVQ